MASAAVSADAKLPSGMNTFPVFFTSELPHRGDDSACENRGAWSVAALCVCCASRRVTLPGRGWERSAAMYWALAWLAREAAGETPSAAGAVVMGDDACSAPCATLAAEAGSLVPPPLRRGGMAVEGGSPVPGIWGSCPSCPPSSSTMRC